MVIKFVEKAKKMESILKRLKEMEGKFFVFSNTNENCFVTKELKDTQFYNNFVITADSVGYKFGSDGDERIERLVMSFFAMSATLLSKLKKTSTKEAVALILQDMTGHFKYGGIVEYHENTENPEEPGNWSYVTTFNEKDITDLEKKKTVIKHFYGGELFQTVFNHVSYDVGSIAWTKESYMYDGCMFVIDCLLQVLDSEAKPGEVVDIEMPGFFKASVAVESDEKIFAITPDGHMKDIIKSDIQLEK